MLYCNKNKISNKLINGSVGLLAFYYCWILFFGREIAWPNCMILFVNKYKFSNNVIIYIHHNIVKKLLSCGHTLNTDWSQSVDISLISLDLSFKIGRIGGYSTSTFIKNLFSVKLAFLGNIKRRYLWTEIKPYLNFFFFIDYTYDRAVDILK